MSKAEKGLYGMFAIGGTIFLAVGLLFVGRIFNYDNTIETVGTITKINVSYDMDGDKDHDVYVAYMANGRRYESMLNGYSSSFYEGKKIDMYYFKDNPQKIGVKSLDYIFLMFPVMGLIFLLIGIIPFITRRVKAKNAKRLKKEGNLVYAKYLRTAINMHYSMNGRNPYNVEVEWLNPEDGQTYTFKSGNLWYNPEDIIREKGITSIPVYVDMTNKKKYFIDLDAILKEQE
ncbi:MAG: DUF3592 domain-containing protein [Bacilli bacterium]|nr:DUF3592 domain-containing protein [Bacilli bacterium]